jgi:HPr kinase/phosphorylase
MNPTLTASQLIEQQQQSLKLKWVAGKDGGDRSLEPPNAKYPGMALVGHLNFVHRNRVQVIGKTEQEYLGNFSGEERAQAIQDLFQCPSTSLVIVSAGEIDDDMIRAADENKLALCETTLPSPVAIDILQAFLTRALAPRETVHGVFIEVMGIGVVITGEAGIGKSELALELLSRGHRMIADDAVELMRSDPEYLVGQSLRHELLEYLEVRGLGIINVRTMFGETAVRHKKNVHFIIRLERLTPERLSDVERLQAEIGSRTILGVEVPEVVLYVAPGRNLAVLVEAATRSHILRMWGMNPMDEFLEKHSALIKKEQE